LQQCWEHRHLREDNWGDVINTLQIAVEGLQLTAWQWTFIGDIAGLLMLPFVSDKAVVLIIRDMRHVGLDPWRGMTETE
jgi:hypothetical protein